MRIGEVERIGKKAMVEGRGQRKGNQAVGKRKGMALGRRVSTEERKRVGKRRAGARKGERKG